MPHKSNLSNRVAASIAQSSGLQAISVFLDLAIMAIMSRLVSPAQFGVLAAAMFFLAICDLLREGGIGSALIQIKDLTPSVYRAAFTIAMAWSIFFVITIYFISDFYASFIRIKELGPVLRVLSVMFPIQVFAIIAQATLQRELRVSQGAMCELIARALSYFTVGLWLAWEGFGYWALVWAWIGESALRSLFMMLVARPVIGFSFDFSAVKMLTSRTTGFATSKIITFIALRADDVVVGRYLDAASLGLYVRAYKLMSQPANLYSSVADRVVFPAFAKLQGDHVRLKAAYLRGINLTALFGLPLTILFYVSAPEVIGVLLGPNWTGVIPIFSVLAIATYFRIGARVSASLLKATASFRLMITSQIIYACLTVVLSLIAVRFGLIAVGAAIGFAVIVWFCIISAMACKLLHIRFAEFAGAHVPGIFLLTIFGAVSYAVSTIGRDIGIGHIGILLMLVTSVLASTIFLFALRPRFILGGPGIWIVELIGNWFRRSWPKPADRD